MAVGAAFDRSDFRPRWDTCARATRRTFWGDPTVFAQRDDQVPLLATGEQQTDCRLGHFDFEFDGRAVGIDWASCVDTLPA